MEGPEQRATLTRLIARDDVSLATLSRVLGRNAAWMQQYLRRGTPKLLPESDRARLARFFGVDEAELGGARGGLVAVRRFDLAASAGPGRIVDDDPASVPVAYPIADLAHLGLSAEDISTIEVEGESMAPTLRHGDRILVDHARTRPGAADAIWVLRVAGELRVKRLKRAGGDWQVISDNRDWADELRPIAEVEVIGRVVHLTRRL